MSKVQERIKQLNEENEKLNLAIHTAQNRKVQIGFILAELNKLVEEPPKAKVAAPKAKTLDTSNMSIRKAILAVMMQNPSKRWSVENIIEALDQTGRAVMNKQQVYNALSALVAEKKLNRVTDGVYGKGK